MPIAANPAVACTVALNVVTSPYSATGADVASTTPGVLRATTTDCTSEPVFGSKFESPLYETMIVPTPPSSRAVIVAAPSTSGALP